MKEVGKLVKPIVEVHWWDNLFWKIYNRVHHVGIALFVANIIGGYIFIAVPLALVWAIGSVLLLQKVYTDAYVLGTILGFGVGLSIAAIFNEWRLRVKYDDIEEKLKELKKYKDKYSISISKDQVDDLEEIKKLVM